MSVLINSKLFKEISYSLEKNYCFDIDEDNKIVKQFNFFKEIYCFYNKKRFNEIKLSVAKFILPIIKKLANEAAKDKKYPRDLIKSDILNLTSVLIDKSQSKKLSKEKVIQDCKICLIAISMGISYTKLIQNKDFLEFVIKSRIYKCFKTFNHKIKLIDDNICILSEKAKKYIPWKQLYDEKIIDAKGKLIGFYGYKGFYQKKQKLSDLKIFMKKDPSKWHHEYTIDLCVKAYDKPRGLGDHTWLRLKTPEGYIYSIGFSSDKEDSFNRKSFLKARRGVIMSPDFAEFSNDPKIYFSSKISYKKFKEALQNLDEDIKSDQLSFQIMKSNCTIYAINFFNKYSNKKIKIGGYYYPKIVYFELLNKLSYYIPPKMYKMGSTINKITYSVFNFFERGFQKKNMKKNFFVKNMINIFRPFNAFCLNFPAFFLGGTILDRQKKFIDRKPYISSFLEMFNLKNSIIYHPFELAEKIKGNIL
ncbi:MAG: hypothetical protein K940chlam5_01027 [Candidatus Anoxychlamydiales bacterium]|nr:hypothetical protein [Candidatus Anoxychlamydiales bacterium]